MRGEGEEEEEEEEEGKREGRKKGTTITLSSCTMYIHVCMYRF